jgi:colanic acid biosynthesis glycosyl transferase WcaI
MATPPAPMPSILFINRAYPPDRGATGRLLRDLAHGFERDGWTVSVLCCGDEGGIVQDGPITVRRIGVRGSARTVVGGLWILGRLTFAAFFAPRADLVVTMTDPPMTILGGWIAAFLKRSLHVHWCQDLYPDLLPVLGYRIPRFLLNGASRMAGAALRASDRVVAIGRCMARRLTQSGLDPRRIEIFPNWPDLELVYAPVESSTPTPRKPHACAAGVRPWDRLLKDESRKFRVLYAGNIGLAHPFETLLDAAEIVSARYPEIEFVFVGEGKGHERLAVERARRGLTNIRQLPWQPVEQLRTLMESGDVHLVSLRHDAAGLMVPSKIYSAFAVGRPCIFVGPQGSEAARLLSDTRAGTVVPQGNPALLADTIIRYRLSSNDWFMAQEGAVRALQAHLPEDVIRQWIDLARALTGTRTESDRGVQDPRLAA